MGMRVGVGCGRRGGVGGKNGWREGDEIERGAKKKGGGGKGNERRGEGKEGEEVKEVWSEEKGKEP